MSPDARRQIPLFLINQLNDMGYVEDIEYIIYGLEDYSKYIVKDGEFVEYVPPAPPPKPRIEVKTLPVKKEGPIPEAYLAFETDEQFEQERKRIRAEYEADPWYDPRAETDLYNLEDHNPMNVAWAKAEAYVNYRDKLALLEKAWRKKFAPPPPPPKPNPTPNPPSKPSESPEKILYKPGEISKRIRDSINHVAESQEEGDANAYEAGRMLFINWQNHSRKVADEDIADFTFEYLTVKVAFEMISCAMKHADEQKNWMGARDAWLLVRTAGCMTDDLEVQDICSERLAELERYYWQLPEGLDDRYLRMVETVRKSVSALVEGDEKDSVLPHIEAALPALGSLRSLRGKRDALYLHLGTLLADSAMRRLYRLSGGQDAEASFRILGEFDLENQYLEYCLPKYSGFIDRLANLKEFYEVKERERKRNSERIAAELKQETELRAARKKREAEMAKSTGAAKPVTPVKPAAPAKKKTGIIATIRNYFDSYKRCPFRFDLEYILWVISIIVLISLVVYKLLNE